MFVESAREGDRSIVPDVRIVEEGRSGGAGMVAETGIAVAEPVLVVAGDEPETQTYIEIIDARSGGGVVTAIEFLSPSNKRPGDGRTLFLRKLEELKGGGVSSVEIDLVRDGLSSFSIPQPLLPESHRRGYAACVHRASGPGQYELYAFPLRERLPAIRIPLRPTDPDVALDLQALIDACYENGGYDTIDYGREPDPALAPEEAGWADAWLREKARRS